MKEHAHSPASGGARLVWKEARTFADILRRRAADQGQAPAFTFLGAQPSEDITLTYAELDQRARSIAAELGGRGLSGQRVLVSLPPGPASVASFFGCLYAGAIAVPVPSPLFNAPLQGPGQMATLAMDSGAAAALVAGQRPAEGQRLTIEGLAGHIDLIAAEAIQGEPPSDWHPPVVDTRAIAFLQYTAGTLGAPKGVRVTHANLLDNCEALRRSLGHTFTDKILLWLPTHQGLGLLEGVLQPLYAGVHCLLMPPQFFFQRPGRWLEALSTSGATVSGAPNFAYELCVRTVSEAERARLDLSRWRVAFSGTEQIRAETLERFAEHFGPSGFQAKAFRPLYGLAESTFLISSCKSDAGPTVRGVAVDALSQQRITERPGAATKLVSSGPAASVQVLIVDPITRAVRSDQEIGEIWVSGLSVADGYWGRVGTTEEVFRGRLTGSASAGRAFLRTGDVGACVGGDLYVTGRLRDVIIWQGQDLRLQDLEFDVESSHPALVPGSCVAVASKQGRNEELTLIAEVLPSEPELPPADSRKRLQDITEAIHRRVNLRHGVTPQAIVLVRAYSLPRSSTGRVSRTATRAVHQASGLKPLTPAQDDEAPRPAPSEALPPRREAAWNATQGLVPLTPALYAVHDPARGLQGRTGACRLFELPAGTEALHAEEALHAVWAAHEPLRMRYTRQGPEGHSGWAALIAPEKEPVPLTRIDLSSRTDVECWPTVEAMARKLGAEVGRCAGALATFVFCARGNGAAPWLMAICHPSLMDESSWRILASDLADGCEQARLRGRVRLAAQSGSLVGWAQQLTTEVRLSRTAEEARTHWLEPSPPHEVAAPALSASGAPAPSAQATVDASALQRAATLLDVSREAVLLTACALAFGTHAQRASVRVSLEQSARGTNLYRVDTSRMLGNLHYAFPTLLSLEPGTAPDKLARRIHLQLLEAPLAGLAYEGLRTYGEDRSLSEALFALPTPDFGLHLEDEGAPSSRGTLRTLAIFDDGPWPGTGVIPLRVEARLSAEQAQLLWHGRTADGELLSTLAKLTEQVLRLLCTQVENLKAVPPTGLGAARVSPPQTPSH
ncbi:AMP-binding protein [Stigmatella sp. ncwal1]|uniref:AMP-binding protein n=1 Tax=Stigmatella ashevillensis TaxID=2995309 RepID=A0ABT5DR98_9BACT|nr:AMP-binding protein [Stigmatella ashevillena]MDC0715233.1 AMP-binding protein [Stigmatella ashevillena]